MPSGLFKVFSRDVLHCGTDFLGQLGLNPCIAKYNEIVLHMDIGMDAGSYK